MGRGCRKENCHRRERRDRRGARTERSAVSAFSAVKFVVLAVAGAAGCTIDVDLRDPSGGDAALPGDPTCAAGERLDPDTGACAPCTYVDPRRVCPCGY